MMMENDMRNIDNRTRNFGLAGKAGRKLLATTALTAAGILAFGGQAKADNWTDHTIDVGNTTVDLSTPNTTNITQTTDFVKARGDGDINAGWTVNVAQPSTSSKYVLFDTEEDPTFIRGALNANGEIYIFDKNGVVFGADSRVDVGSLITSTGYLTDEDILDGDGKFTFLDVDTGGAITVDGSITVAEAGLAAFVAPTVSNNGIISAKLGKVALASGDVVTLDLYGDKLVEIAVDDKVADGLIENAGTISAEGGTVVLSVQTAKEAVDNVINVDGIIDVASATVKGGKIVLAGGNQGVVKVSGTLDASGTDGGAVGVTGENVHIAETASVSVDGGKGADGQGDGGTAYIYGDKYAVLEGSLSGRGGANGGNGGFAELSAGDSVGLSGLVDLGADNGDSGTFLIDPAHLFINDSYSFFGFNVSGGGSTLTIYDQALANALGLANVNLWATEDINVNSAIDLSTWAVASFSGITSHDLTIAAPEVNLLHDIILGTGSLNVADITTLDSVLGFGIVTPPYDILVDHLNLSGKIYTRNGLGETPVLAADSQLFTTADTINVSTGALIQQAIQFADDTDADVETVNVAAGTYQEDLVIDRSLKLAGADGAILQSNGGDSLITVTANNVNIDPFVFDGLGSTDYGINASGANNLIVDGNTFQGFVLANVKVSDSRNVRIFGNTMTGAEKGVDADNTVNIWVHDNDISGATVAGVHLANTDGTNYANDADIWFNRIDSAAGATGVLVENSNYATVGAHLTHQPNSNDALNGNVITGGKNGVVVLNSDNAMIRHNEISGQTGGDGPASGDGIYVADSTGVEIRNNYVHNTADEGIQGDNADDAIVADNIIEDAGRIGISLMRGSDNQSITGNMISRTGNSGIFSSGDGTLTITGNTIDTVGQTSGGNSLRDDGIHIDTLFAEEGSNNPGDGFDSGLVDGNIITNAPHAGIEIVNIDSGLTVSNNNITGGAVGIYNNGSDNTVIKANTIIGAATGVLVNPSANVFVENNIITGGTFGVSVLDSSDVWVRDNDITGAGTGIYGDNAEDIKVSDNTVTDSTSVGIHVKNSPGTGYGGGGNDVDIWGNTVTSLPGTTGIRVENSNFATIGWHPTNPFANATTGGNTVTGGLYGILVNNSDNAYVAHNDVSGASFAGIYVYGGSDASTVFDNTLLNNLNNILVYGGSNHNVLSNTIDGGARGIWFYQTADNNTADDNTIGATTGVSDVAIRSTAATGSTFITNNHIYNTGWDGVQVQGGTGFMTIQKNEIDNTTGASGIALLDHLGGGLIDDNDIDGADRLGIYSQRSNNYVISNNTVNDTGREGANWWTSGIHLEGSNNTMIFANTVTNTNNGGDGIQIGGAGNLPAAVTTGNVISGNVISSTSGDGIQVQDSTGVQIVSNFVGYTDNTATTTAGNDNIGGDGIEISGSDNALVSGNKIIDAAANGVYNNGSDSTTIIGNVITSVGGNGVLVNPSFDVDVINNVISGALNGVKLENSSNILVSGNTISMVNDGIHVTNMGGTLEILGNTVGAYNHGIYFADALDNGDDVDIHGNTIEANLDNGVIGSGIWFNGTVTGATVDIGNGNGATLNSSPSNKITVNAGAGDVSGLDGIHFDKEVGTGAIVRIDGNRLGYTGALAASALADDGIEFKGPVTGNADIDIEDNWINATDDGVQFSGTVGGTSNVHIGGNGDKNTIFSGDDGIAFRGHIQDSAVVTISDNTIDAGGDGVETNGVVGATLSILNNLITAVANGVNMGAGSPSISGGATVMIAGNTIDSEDDGIYVDDEITGVGTTLTVRNNSIDSDEDGIDIDSVNHGAVVTIGGSGSIDGNTIKASGNGIEFDAGIDATVLVQKNRISAGEDGINIRDEDAGHVTGVDSGALVRILDNKIGSEGSDTIGDDGIDFDDAVTGNSTVIISGNKIGRSGAKVGDDGIDFDSITGGANVQIINNPDIRAADNGIEVSGPVNGGATVLISGNNHGIHADDHGIFFGGAIGGGADIDIHDNIISANEDDGSVGDGIHFDGNIYTATINIGDGSGNGFLNNPSNFIRGKDGIHFDGSLNNGSQIVIDGNRIGYGKGQTYPDSVSDDGIQFIGDINGNANVKITDNYINANDDGISFIGKIRDNARVLIGGQYDGNKIWSDDEGIQFEDDIRDHSLLEISYNTVDAEGNGVEFDGETSNHIHGSVNPEEILIRNNSITGKYDGIAFYGRASHELHDIMIRDNDLIKGEHGNGITHTGGIDDAELTIQHNEKIDGNDDGIHITGHFYNDALIRIHGNGDVRGRDDDGIHVEDYGNDEGLDLEIDYNHVHWSDDDGIFVKNIEDADIHNNTVHNVGGNGIYGSHVDGADISANTIYDVGQNGILVNPSDYVTIAWNTIHDTGWDGVHVDNGYGAFIRNNWIERTGGDGIQTENNGKVLALWNYIHDAGDDGIDVEGAEFVKVAYNVIDDAWSNGIEVEDSGKAIIKGNIVKYAGLDGILLDGFDRGIVKHNFVYQTGDDGIDVRNGRFALIKENTVRLAGKDFRRNVRDFNDRHGSDGIYAKYVLNPFPIYVLAQQDEASYAYIGGNDWNLVIVGNDIDKSVDDGIQTYLNGNIKIDANIVDNSGYGGDSWWWNKKRDGHGADGIHVHNGLFEHGLPGQGDQMLMKSSFYDGPTPYFLSTTVEITDNVVTNSADDGIESEGVTDLLIHGNDVSFSGDDGIHVLGYAGFFEDSEEEEYYEDTRYTIALYSPGSDIEFGFAPGIPEFNTVVSNNVVTESGGDGAEISGYDRIGFLGNDVSNSAANGLYVSGPFNGNDEGEGKKVTVAGNTFTDNDIGAHFESGLIDLTGERNFFTGGRIGMRFAPFDWGTLESRYVDGDTQKITPRSFGGWQGWPIHTWVPTEGFAAANLRLVDDDGGPDDVFGGNFPPTNFDGTIGAQTFRGQSSYFVELANEAFYAPGNPTLLNGLESSYFMPGLGFITPSSTGGILTLAQFNFLQSKFFHYPNTGNLGLFFFGFVPGIDQEDIFKRFDPFSGSLGGLNVTVTGLPTVPGTPGALNNISPFAGGDEEGGEPGVTPEALNEIETAAGESSPATCWGDAINAAGAGQVVNYSFGTSFEDTIAGAASCSTQF